MILLVDANILFSALIKESLTADLLFEENFQLYAPEFIISEFFNYEDLILIKSSRTKEQFIQIMHMLKEIITLIPKEEYYEFMKEAEGISPDKDDIAYIALALKLKCGIWSNDKELKKQDKVKIYSTEEIMKLI